MKSEGLSDIIYFITFALVIILTAETAEIIDKKARSLNLILPPEIIRYIAANVRSNFFEIEIEADSIRPV